jgi:hypothetical protein
LEGFDPKNPYFQQATEFFWSYYAKEVNSWRDQPLWCYTLDRFHITPISINMLFEPSWSRIGYKGHHYGADADSNAANSNQPANSSSLIIS